MGQAKNRGTYEKRVAQALSRPKVVEVPKPIVEKVVDPAFQASLDMGQAITHYFDREEHKMNKGCHR